MNLQFLESEGAALSDSALHRDSLTRNNQPGKGCNEKSLPPPSSFAAMTRVVARINEDGEDAWN
jgi:hypothetical protein